MNKNNTLLSNTKTTTTLNTILCDKNEKAHLRTHLRTKMVYLNITLCLMLYGKVIHIKFIFNYKVASHYSLRNLINNEMSLHTLFRLHVMLLQKENLDLIDS